VTKQNLNDLSVVRVYSQLAGLRVWTLNCMGLFLDCLYWQNEIPVIFLFSCHEGPSTPQPLSLSVTTPVTLHYLTRTLSVGAPHQEESDNMSVSETSEREKMTSEVFSIASSAASMTLEEARAEVSKLRTEKHLMEQQLAKKAASPNKILHDKILKETTNIYPKIMDMDICPLWWVLQWIEERKTDLGKTDIHKLSSYMNWVWKNKVKDRAGMKHDKPTPFSQGNTPAKNTGGTSAGSD
jgi:hypothetical protein